MIAPLFYNGPFFHYSVSSVSSVVSSTRLIRILLEPDTSTLLISFSLIVTVCSPVSRPLRSICGFRSEIVVFATAVFQTAQCQPKTVIQKLYLIILIVVYDGYIIGRDCKILLICLINIHFESLRSYLFGQA